MNTQIRVRVQTGIAAGTPAPGPVVSVAGRTGAVVLDVSDVTGLSASLAGKAPINSPTFTGTVSGITASMVGAPSGSGTSSGTNTGDETETRIGTLIAAATDKATPVDADSLALSDSAAGGILRRFSWASLKAALNGVFARLAGVSGGQTLNGGTASGENLTLRSTAHATRGAIIFGAASEYDEANDRLGIGTLTPSAKVHSVGTTEQLRLGYDASNYLSATVSLTGLATLIGTLGQYSLAGPTTASATAALGSQLITNGEFTADLSGWTAGAGWSWSSGAALHSSGTATLEQSVTVVSGSTYQLDIVITGRTAGSITVALGAVSVIESGAATSFTATLSRSVVAGATGSVLLAITPTTDFNGAIDSVSLNAVTLGTHPVVLGITESGSPALQIRQSFSRSNLAFGRDSGRSNTTGYNNSNVGVNAGYSNTTGNSNSNVGVNAGYSNTTGYNNSNCGRDAGRANTTGSNNTNVGLNAGRYVADGVTGLTTPSNCCYFGSSAKASADGVTNENVFGYNATGIGSNSCVLGSSAVTKCQIFGDIILDKTITAAGTTGAQTINKTVGSVNFAAGATSLVVTNSRVTTSSVIVATVATADATMKSVVAVAAAGSFTLTANAAATAETRVNWIVIN